MKVLTLLDYIDFLPNNIEYVVCGKAAVRLLGLTSMPASLSLYCNQFVPRMNVEVFPMPLTLDVIYVTKRKIPCTSIEQTISDLIASGMSFGTQYLNEALATLFSYSDDGEYDLTKLEEFLKVRGQYAAYKAGTVNIEEFWYTGG